MQLNLPKLRTLAQNQVLLLCHFIWLKRGTTGSWFRLNLITKQFETRIIWLSALMLAS